MPADETTREVLLRSVIESLEGAYHPQLVKVEGEHPADFIRRRFEVDADGYAAVQEQWRVVAADGKPRTPEHESVERCGALVEWDKDFIGGPHRYQRRVLIPSEWQDAADAQAGDGP